MVGGGGATLSLGGLGRGGGAAAGETGVNIWGG